MKYTKKQDYFSYAVSLCAVCIAALMTSVVTQAQETYYDAYYDQPYYDEQSNYVDDGYMPYSDDLESEEMFYTEQTSIPVVYEKGQPVYPSDETDYSVSVEDKSTHPCYQVKNGQIIGSANLMHGSLNTPPCMKAMQEKTQIVNQEQVGCGCGCSQTSPCPFAQQTEIPCNQADHNCAKYANLFQNKHQTATTDVASTPSSSTSSGASSVNIETPARCQIALNGSEIMSSIPVGDGAFELVRMDKSDELPRHEVNDYTFKDMPLDLAIQNLLSEAGIRVYSDDALFPDVSGENVRGELTSVINELTAAGDIYYRYDSAQKHLILSRWARFALKVPGGRIGMYAILDALRGANITNVQPDFGTNEIYMRINTEKQETISKLVNAIKQAPNLLLFDVRVFRLTKTTPNKTLNWQELLQNFGVTKINSSVNGIVGRMLAMKHQPNRSNIIDMLRPYGSVSVISEGVAVMPSDWKVRFDIGQCVKFETPEHNLSMLFQSSILSKNRAESSIALDTPRGEITAFHTIYNIDDTLNIIGIPGKIFNPTWGDNVEYVITLKPRIVRLVK